MFRFNVLEREFAQDNSSAGVRKMSVHDTRDTILRDPKKYYKHPRAAGGLYAELAVYV